MEHATRAAFTPPEITQVDLAGLVLELGVWGVAPESLSLLDPPPTAAWNSARELLATLGAVDPTGRPTPLGQSVVELPVHPRLGVMVDRASAGDPALVGGGRTGVAWTAVVLAALLSERDILRGSPADLPSDLALRAQLVDDPGRRHPDLDVAAVRRVRDTARELASRRRVEVDRVDIDSIGALLATAYPDRVGQLRGGRGRFRLRSGTGAWVPAVDPLSDAPFVVAADVDGDRRNTRIRRGAALSEGDLQRLFGGEMDRTDALYWDEGRDDLRSRRSLRLGALDLGTAEEAAPPGDATSRALLGRLRTQGTALLGWTPTSRQIVARVAFLRSLSPDPNPWPDWSEVELARTVDTWLGPALLSATGRADLGGIDPGRWLLARLDPQLRAELERLAPTRITLTNGRTLPIDYSEGPRCSAPLSHLFGVEDHPLVCGGTVPVVLDLLNPADRTVQITADLPGFWTGSWALVRKELRSRYPKHDWPEDPRSAQPR